MTGGLIQLEWPTNVLRLSIPMLKVLGDIGSHSVYTLHYESSLVIRVTEIIYDAQIHMILRTFFHNKTWILTSQYLQMA